MTILPPRAQRRALTLRLRLRLARHGRRIVTSVILAAWFVAFAIGLPLAGDGFAADPPGFGLLALYALLAALTLSWSEAE
jgi:hypothetical protein